MAITVTRTKIIVPRRRNDLLSRDRLNHLLDDLLDYKLLLIAAPAGYGKTSLLVDWVHQNDLPVCWYALDPLDRDLTRFISYLIASISQVFSGFGGQSRAALENYENSKLDVTRILTAIVNDAYENIKEHFVIVLDDFHTVDIADDVNEFVNRFASEMDENCHLVLVSRTLLSLPDLPLMVGRSMVKGLSYDELAFRAGEIQALLLQNYHHAISDDVAVELQLETEGWITGLLLSAQTMWEGMTDRVRVARASGVGLYDYLAQQVLNQQAPVVRDFLLKTSLLEEFDVELCQAVMGGAPRDSSWVEVIREVLQNNLFVLPVENKGTWLRYHHLFRDFLQNRIFAEQPEEANLILRRLAEIYVQRDEWEKAYNIYQRLQDESGIVGLIERAGSFMLRNGQLELLNNWLDDLKPDIIRSRPQLLSLLGSLDILFSRVELGISRLNRAEFKLEKAGDLQQLALLLMRRSTGYRFIGNYQKALSDVDKALSLVKGMDELRDIYAEALRLKALCFYRLGNLDLAIQISKEALTAFQSLSNQRNEALTHLDLGLANMDSGHLADALVHYEQSLSYWHRTGDIARKINVLNNIGVLHHLKGDYIQASKYLDETLILARKSGNTRIEAYALASIGDLYADLDAFEPARQVYRQAREISNRINSQRLLIYSYLAEASVDRREGDLVSARMMLENVTPLIQKSDSTYEHGLYLLISGQVALAGGDLQGAILFLNNANEKFEKGGQEAELIYANLALAHAYCQLGDVQRSFTHLGRVLQMGKDRGSLHALLVASRSVKPVLCDSSIPAALKSQVKWLEKQTRNFEKRIPEYRNKLKQQGLVISIEQMPRITIQALGKSQVRLAGEPVSVPEWSNQKAVRELFFLLLANPKGLTKDEIGLILWPESSQKRLKVQFKNALYRLRRALGNEVILFDKEQDMYQFNRSIDYEFDVESFRNEINAAKNDSGPGKFIAYEAAIKAYQGSYLPDSEGLWVFPEREQLWQEYLSAELTLAHGTFDKGDYQTALSHIRSILSVDPCQEDAHRLAMQVHAAKGNQADLVRQYEICKDALMSELGVVPSPQTEALYLDLLAE